MRRECVCVCVLYMHMHACVLSVQQSCNRKVWGQVSLQVLLDPVLQ